jgi:hypothetical protein
MLCYYWLLLTAKTKPLSLKLLDCKNRVTSVLVGLVRAIIQPSNSLKTYRAKIVHFKWKLIFFYKKVSAKTTL